MLKRKGGQIPDIDLKKFAEFNQKLFFNPDLPATHYSHISHPPQAHI